MYHVFIGRGGVAFGAGSNEQILGDWFVSSSISGPSVNVNATAIMMSKHSSITDHFSASQAGSFAWCLQCAKIRKVTVPGSDQDYPCSTPLKTFDKPGLRIVGVQQEEEVPNDPHTHAKNTGGKFIWNGAKGQTM